MLTKYTVLFLAVFVLISCGEDEPPTPNNNGNGDNNPIKITQEQLNGLTQPCINANVRINLPAALLDPNNYNNDSYAAQVVQAVAQGNIFVESYNGFIMPDANATVVEPDDFNVSEGDEAYTWGEIPNQFLYINQEDGYKILQFIEESQLIGNTYLTVEQSDDCSDFEFTQNNTIAENGIGVGDKLFRYYHSTRGNINLRYGIDEYKEGNEYFELREFNDNSGDLYYRVNGETKTVFQWYSNGNGNWREVENNETVSTGTWEF